MPISLYNPTQRAGVNTGQPNLQAGNLDVAGAYMRNNPMEGVMALTKGALTLGKHLVDTNRIASVSEQSLNFMKDLSAFKTDYMRKNQGKNAIEAGAAFEAYAQERMAKLEEESGLDWQGRIMLARTTGPTAISFISQGHGYGMQQENAWKDSTAKGLVASLSQFTAENYNNPDLVNAQRDLTKTQLAGMYPGMDMTAQFAAIDQQATADRINAYLADGNDAAAEGLFRADRRLLGPRADEMAMKLANRKEHNLRMSLAYEEKARRAQERADKQMSEKIQKDVIDNLISGNHDKANEALIAGRDVISASDYKPLAYAARKPPTASTDNVHSVAQLLTLQRSADPAVRARLVPAAEAAYLNGDLTKGTYQSLVDTQIQDGDAQALRGLQMAFEGASKTDPAAAASLTNATFDYLSWARSEPNATYEKRLAKSRELADSYSIINRDEFILSFGFNKYTTKPGFLQAQTSRSEEQYIDDAEARLAEDLRSGAISRREAAATTLQIQRLRAVVNRNVQRRSNQSKGNVQ